MVWDIRAVGKGGLQDRERQCHARVPSLWGQPGMCCPAAPLGPAMGTGTGSTQAGKLPREEIPALRALENMFCAGTLCCSPAMAMLQSLVALCDPTAGMGWQ